MSLKLPNDKIVYNLPEQVGVNTENIKYLAETYKNLDEQVATWPEYKAEWDQFSLDYAGWTTTLDTYLANMSSAAVGAIAGQDIAPKTVSQSDFNFERAFNLSANSGFSIQNVYNRFAEINNVLHIIVNFSITNISGTAQTLGSGYGDVGFVALSLDEQIAEKIYDIEGKTVKDGTATLNCLIASEPAQIMLDKVLNSSTKFYMARLSLVNRAAANTCGVYVSLNGNTADRITVNDGDTLYITARMSLTLL